MTQLADRPPPLNASFLCPPDFEEVAALAPVTPADRLARSMRSAVLDRWDHLNENQRDRALREYGAALAVIMGFSQNRLHRGARIGRGSVGKILQLAREGSVK